jgi:hypothetical protein
MSESPKVAAKAVPVGFEASENVYATDQTMAGAGLYEDAGGNKVAFARATDSFSRESRMQSSVFSIAAQAGIVRKGDVGVQAAFDGHVFNIDPTKKGLPELSIARAHAKVELATRHIDVEAGARAAELGAHNDEGDVFKVMAGFAAGIGLHWGNDPDGDGHRNYGIRAAAAYFWGVEIGFSIEPGSWFE